MDPKEVHVQIAGTGKYVTLHGRGDSVDVTKLRVLKWGGYPGLSGQPNVITRVLKRQRQEVRENRAGCAIGFHGRGHEPQKVKSLWKLGKVRDRALPKPPKDRSPASALIYSPQDPCLDF